MGLPSPPARRTAPVATRGRMCRSSDPPVARAIRALRARWRDAGGMCAAVHLDHQLQLRGLVLAVARWPDRVQAAVEFLAPLLFGEGSRASSSLMRPTSTPSRVAAAATEPTRCCGGCRFYARRVPQVDRDRHAAALGNSPKCCACCAPRRPQGVTGATIQMRCRRSGLSAGKTFLRLDEDASPIPSRLSVTARAEVDRPRGGAVGFGWASSPRESPALLHPGSEPPVDGDGGDRAQAVPHLRGRDRRRRPDGVGRVPDVRRGERARDPERAVARAVAVRARRLRGDVPGRRELRVPQVFPSVMIWLQAGTMPSGRFARPVKA